MSINLRRYTTVIILSVPFLSLNTLSLHVNLSVTLALLSQTIRLPVIDWLIDKLTVGLSVNQSISQAISQTLIESVDQSVYFSTDNKRNYTAQQKYTHMHKNGRGLV